MHRLERLDQPAHLLRRGALQPLGEHQQHALDGFAVQLGHVLGHAFEQQRHGRHHRPHGPTDGFVQMGGDGAAQFRIESDQFPVTGLGQRYRGNQAHAPLQRHAEGLGVAFEPRDQPFLGDGEHDRAAQTGDGGHELEGGGLEQLLQRRLGVVNVAGGDALSGEIQRRHQPEEREQQADSHQIIGNRPDHVEVDHPSGQILGLEEMTRSHGVPDGGVFG